MTLQTLQKVLADELRADLARRARADALAHVAARPRSARPRRRLAHRRAALRPAQPAAC